MLNPSIGHYLDTPFYENVKRGFTVISLFIESKEMLIWFTIVIHYSNSLAYIKVPWTYRS